MALRMLLAAGLMGLAAQTVLATDFGRPYQRDSLALNGQWQVLLENGDREVWKPEVAAGLGPWETLEVPGKLIPGVDRPLGEKTTCVWARKSFTIDPAHADKSVVLRYNGIRFGAVAYVNGQKVDEHAAVGPNTVLVPAGLVHAGVNELVLKVGGWAGVPRGASGWPLFPAGASTQSWGSKQAGIFYDIWLEFYDRAYVKWVLAMPDVKNGTVTFRVWLAGDALPAKIDLGATVAPDLGAIASGRGTLTVVDGRSPVDLTVPIADVKLWSPEARNLYGAHLTAWADGKPCDDVRFRFGMRDFQVADGHFQLNGERIWLRGSNLVNEWGWGDTFNNDIKRYISTEARAMNLNCFRTHTCPPPNLWMDVADETGTLFLPEFPLLYNTANFKFTPAEYEVFHRNALTDATGWVTMLWNHPSVALWVLSNESRGDDRWEATVLRDHVRALDPTRPCMRSDGNRTGTVESLDIHTCWNYAREPEGRLQETVQRWVENREPKRTLGNTEYMNYPGGAARWLGQTNARDDARIFAEFGLEHTEAMRRAQLDCILPYMYAGWTGMRGSNWRPDFPTPMAAALHSAMAPVLASLDLFDRNYLPGQEVTTRLVLINEKRQDVPATLELYLTPKDPLFVPDAEALAAAVWREKSDVTFKADSMIDRPIKWKAPEKEGTYFLAAVVTRPGDRPVVSQREVRTVSPASAVRRASVVVLGADPTIQKWLGDFGLTPKALVANTPIDADAVLVWDARALTDAERASAPAILDFARRGGRAVIVDQGQWDWKELADFGLDTKTVWSRAFAYPQVSHPVLAGIDPALLMRWNGLPGTVADRTITGEAVKTGRKLLWMKDPANPIVVSVPMDKGEIVISMLHLRRHVAGGSGAHDPAADRILMNLLTR